MPQTFLFEELDDATRDYLTAVRAAEGSATPGIFAATSSALAGCGCVGGPIIIIATLCLTLTNWINVIYDDPVRVALLQRATHMVSKGLVGTGQRLGHSLEVGVGLLLRFHQPARGTLKAGHQLSGHACVA